MTVNEFYDEIEYGGDIVIEVVGNRYTICAWADELIDVAEQGTLNNHARFSNAGEFVENYLINGKPIKDLMSDVTIVFRS